MLSAAHYEKLLERLESADESGKLCLFTTHRGSRYNSELMICGRATNGFDPHWTLHRASTRNGREAIVAETLAERAKVPCPMKWITDNWGPNPKYSTARSAFWRVAKRIVAGLQISDDSASWSSYLAWTNLYRVAPAERGNPSARLQNTQIDWCKQALTEDVLALQPRRLLLMTGTNWAGPFISNMQLQEWAPSALVQAWGRWILPTGAPIAVVVAKHPQGKPENKFVSGVLDAFRDADERRAHLNLTFEGQSCDSL